VLYAASPSRRCEQATFRLALGLIQGKEDPFGGSVTYMDGSGTSVRSVIVTRDFSTGPPDEFFATHVDEAPISIQGHGGVIEFPPAAPYSATRIAWRPLPQHDDQGEAGLRFPLFGKASPGSTGCASVDQAR
jgi:hypothetical protein